MPNAWLERLIKASTAAKQTLFTLKQGKTSFVFNIQMLGQGDERFAKLPFNPAAGKFTLCWVRETRMTLSLSVNSSILNCKSLSLPFLQYHWLLIRHVSLTDGYGRIESLKPTRIGAWWVISYYISTRIGVECSTLACNYSHHNYTIACIFAYSFIILSMFIYLF